jgi:hypothetical protein
MTTARLTDAFNSARKEQDYAALKGPYAGDDMLVRSDGVGLNIGISP